MFSETSRQEEFACALAGEYSLIMKLSEESVWDYPRPPLCEPVDYELKVVLAGQVVAQTKSGFRVCETSHPPTYYIPPDDIMPEALQPVEGSSLCEFKGKARYFDVRVGDHVVERSAWAYDTPTAAFGKLPAISVFMPKAWRLALLMASW